MQDRHWIPSHNNHALHKGPFIPCKEDRGPRCDITGLKCAACLTAKATLRTPRSRGTATLTAHSPNNDRPCHNQLIIDREMILKQGHTKPGECVSADHYISAIQRCLFNTFGHEKQGYTCGTLFVDHASGKIFNFSQYSNTAAETIRSALRLEAMAREEGFKIKSYHSDNGIFACPEFKQHCSSQNQKYNFGAVGAKHQNGIAERNIKTVAQWAWANMLHLATRGFLKRSNLVPWTLDVP